MKFTTSIAVLALLVPALAQSSAPASAASSGASAVSSAASSAASAASSAAASASPSGGASADYLTAVLAALTANNLTGLAGVAGAIVNTTEGAALLGQLSRGNKTVFAPNNAAFAAVPAEIANNPQLLTQILAYHIANNTYLPSGIATAPGHTIARTLLYGGNFTLPGNRSAPLVLAKNSTNATSFNIVQAAANNSAMGPVAAANLQVYIIDTVLTLPPTIAQAATQFTPQLAQAAGTAGLLDALAASDALTIFAPNDAAFQAISSTLGTLNATQVGTVLGNHIINGTAVYSDRLTTSNYTSASGSPFTFMSNATGVFVMSGNSTARIIQSDVITENGVIHLIDRVLVNAASNPGAAASAFSSATGAATSMEPTAPVTATSSAAASGASGSGAAASSSRSAGSEKVSWNFGVMGVGAVVTAVGAMLGGGCVLM